MFYNGGSFNEDLYFDWNILNLANIAEAPPPDHLLLSKSVFNIFRTRKRKNQYYLLIKTYVDMSNCVKMFSKLLKMPIKWCLREKWISYDQANYDVGIFSRKSGRHSIQLNKVSMYYYLCGSMKNGTTHFFFVKSIKQFFFHIFAISVSGIDFFSVKLITSALVNTRSVVYKKHSIGNANGY